MNRALLFLVFMAFVVTAKGQKLLKKISAGSDVTVVIFLATDCPVSQKYIPALNQIHDQYADKSVTIHAVIPGKISQDDLAIFRKEYGIKFALSPDRRYRFVKMLSATTTPEVIVVDKHLRTKYRGAIDNWFYELGGYRKEADELYLINALDALLNNQQPAVASTEAIGCLIQHRKN